MRKIDADALMTDIKECIEVKYANSEYEQIEGLEVALSCVDEQPTIEERKKGEWIPCDADSRGMTNMFVCSKCGSFTSLPILKYANAMEYDFCPHCGADMRGRDE